MDINSAIQQLLKSNLSMGSAPLNTVAPVTPTTISTSPTVPITNDYVKQAYQELIPYYTKLLQENGNDVNLAINRLKEDYQTGVRYTTQDVATQSGRTLEDLNSSLESLGITFPKEQANLLDSLNQRGIALNQNPDASLTYAGGGQPKNDVSALGSDQSLRKEAVQRNAQRSLTDLGTSGTRQIDTYNKTLTRGTQDAVRGQQQYGEKTQQDIENQALNMGQSREANAANAQTIATNNAINQSILGGGSSGGSNTRTHINPVSGVWDDNYYSTGKTG